MEEKMLLHQEALLVQELELIRAKLTYVRLLKSEQQKENCSPSSSQSKEQSSPVQTETGKDASNPLMVNILPKDMNEVQTSITLEKSSDLNLRPNGGIQIPQIGVISVDGHTSKSGIQIPDKNSKQYYVVFNGPNAGIYDNW